VRPALVLVVSLASALCASVNDGGGETGKLLQEQARLHPDSFQANHLLGEFLVHQNRLAAAIAPLEKAEHIAPAEYANSYDLAAVYLQIGRTRRSRELITKLLKQQDKAELHNLLAGVEAAESNFQEAAQQYEIAARIDPSEKNLFDLGSYLSLHRGFEPAIKVFKFGTQRYPQSARLRVGMGVAFYSVGQYDDAVDSLCQAVDLDPADTKPLEFLGMMHDISALYAADVTKRLAHFAQIYPSNANANYYYALSLRKRTTSPASETSNGDAEQYLRKAAALKPSFAEPHFELGLLYEEEAKGSKATAEFELATKLRPSHAKAHYHLARLYQRDGRKELAQKEFRAFRALKTKN